MTRGWLIAAMICACLVGACGRREHQPDRADPVAVGRAQALAWLRTARFEDADRATDCQPDCGEQERGFAFARAHAIEQPGDCDLERVRAAANEDFIEGCRAYGQYVEAAERRR